MKRTVFLPALAAIAFIASLNVVSAQPDYRYGPRRNFPDYNRQQLPAAPVIIIDADGRRSNGQYRNFDNYNKQQMFNRNQRKKLEKRYGYAPPLIIYVPDRFVDRSGFYVYNNNIVYRRDRDGYFHLDSRYYNDNWNDFDNRYDRNDSRWSNNYPNRY
jgi:hypothetical protein